MQQKVPLKKSVTPEMLQKVTGTGRQPVPPVPPPAKPGVRPSIRPPAGSSVRGDLPLPVGKPIPVEEDLPGWDAQHSSQEKSRLTIDQAAAEAIADAKHLVPPVDPRRPPLEVNTIHAEHLPHGPERSSIEQKVADAGSQFGRLHAAPRPTTPPRYRHPSIQQAAEFAEQQLAHPEDDVGIYEKVQQQNPKFRGEVRQAVESYKGLSEKGPPVDQRVTPPMPSTLMAKNKQPQYESLPPKEPESQEAEVERGSETGADAPAPLCSHCGWPRDVPDGTNPTREDKVSYLACWIGGVPFTKVFKLFDGRVAVSFRTLTTKEIDSIYLQTYFDEKAGKINGPMERYERLNRYRLYLQLQQILDVANDQLMTDLPDGMDGQTAPKARRVWVVDDIDPTCETPLPTIESHIVSNVLGNESMHRVLTITNNEFNRMVAKMESTAGSPDFLTETGEPS